MNADTKTLYGIRHREGELLRWIDGAASRSSNIHWPIALFDDIGTAAIVGAAYADRIEALTGKSPSYEIVRLVMAVLVEQSIQA